MVHIYDLCWRNQLTLTSASDNGDVTHQMDQDGTSTATTISQIAFTSTEDETECPLVRTIEIWLDDSETWLEYDSTDSSHTSGYPWITNIVNDSGFDVSTEDYATYDNENIDPTVFQMRQTVADDNSDEDEWKIYDYFEVTLKYECDDDVLSLSSDIGYQEYQIDSGSVNFPANVAQTISGCQIDELHEVWDDDLQSWVDLTALTYTWLVADPADGAFDVDQAWDSTYVPYIDYTIRITYESVYSQMSDDERIQTDQYVLRIGDVCKYDTLTKNSEFAEWTYIIFSTSASETE